MRLHYPDLRDYILYEWRKGYRWYEGKFHASSLGVCPRAMCYWIQGAEPCEPCIEDVTPMWMGSLIHEGLQPLLGKLFGFSDAEQELVKTYRYTVRLKDSDYSVELPVVGHQDHRGRDEGTSILQEYKTFGKYRYGMILKAHGDREAMWDERAGFYRELLQTQFYMDAGEHDAAEVWAVCRDNGRFFSFMEVKEPMRLRRGLAKVAWVVAKWEVEKLMPKRPYQPKDIQCKICDFRFHCHGEEAQSLNG